ncbi:MAG: hypothetical protein DI535_22765 [Citrobacter freundii]|nr:MAG: hypothetical protein DI535_22765 [Citrobacter freundii]
MRTNKVKRWVVLGALLGVSGIGNALLAQQVIGTLKQGTHSNEVDVYVKSTAATTSTQYYTNLILPVGVKTSCITGTAPKATLTYFGSTGMSWFSVNDGGTQTNGLDITSPTTTTSAGYTVYAFNGTNSNTTAANLPANTEVKIATIAFNNSTGSCPVYLMNNSNSSVDYFYMTLNTGATVDENNWNNNMYAVAPNTVVNDGTVGVKTSANIVLPLKLGNFEAAQNGTSVKLEWNTLYEENISAFVVERSSDGTSNFVQIATVAATGSAIGSSYSAEDRNPVKGVNYYRLKMVDRDGRVSYSQMRVVRFEVEQDGNVHAFPTINTTGTLYVELPRGWERAGIFVLNASGQRMDGARVSNTSSLSRNVSLKGLTSGLYLVSVINEYTREQQTIKVNYHP